MLTQPDAPMPRSRESPRLQGSQSLTVKFMPLCHWHRDWASQWQVRTANAWQLGCNAARAHHSFQPVAEPPDPGPKNFKLKTGSRVSRARAVNLNRDVHSNS